MSLPIGYDNFRDLIDKNIDFVDKSLFIQDILDDNSAQVAVITRPRRFGKTLSLSMLYHFLSGIVDDQPTVTLFDHLKIARLGDSYMQHQGRYPVIFITFKNIINRDFASAYQNLTELMVETFGRYSYLDNSEKLLTHQIRAYRRILNGEGNETQLSNALKTLTECLYQHHKVKPWLLIDEYDTPIQSAYLSGSTDYYDRMIFFMRGMFGSALKTNAALNRSVITGILRVAKESLFSGVNNLKVYSLLQDKYSTHFGFTEDEVTVLATKYQVVV